MAKYTRTSIAIPEELKARMDAVKIPESWSQVACRAFEQRLAEVAKKEGPKNMSDVINRLRVSKQAAGTKSYNEGFASGERWAKQTAEAIELDRLEKFHDETDGAGGWSFEDWFDIELNAPWSHASYIAGKIYGSDYPREAEKLQERLFAEDDQEDSDHLRGFVDGALGVWTKVKGQI